MGLDMYLTARIYTWSPSENQQLYKQAVLDHNLSDLIDPDAPGMEVAFNVGYWRKANQIHKWFVDNVQDGNDNCGEYYVSPDKLMELYKLCKELLDNPDKAMEKLPPTSGFFFGQTDINEWYFNDLRDTVEILGRALPFKDRVGFWYHSSW